MHEEASRARGSLTKKKRKWRRARFLAALLSLSGCGQVGVEIATVVHEDGSFDRTVTYTVKDADRELLRREYELPAGRSWDLTGTTRNSDPVSGMFRSELFVYEARGTFHALENDYGRRDFQNPPAWSRNRIAIQATPAGYTYRETFSDTANVSELRRLGRTFTRRWVENSLRDLRETVLRQESDATVATIQTHVTTSALGYFEQIWHRLETIESKLARSAVDALVGETDAFLATQIDQWWQADGAHYPPEGGMVQIQQALEDSAERQGDEESGNPYEADLKRFGGAYLPAWTERTYPFKVTVTMPTKITKSNADSVRGETAAWEFDPLYFLLKDYTLTAEAENAAAPERR